MTLGRSGTILDIKAKIKVVKSGDPMVKAIDEQVFDTCLAHTLEFFNAVCIRCVIIAAENKD